MLKMTTKNNYYKVLVRNQIIENIPNLDSVNIGKGVHFLQEDNPSLIGEKIKEFILKLK